MVIEILAWVTVIGIPIAAFAAIIYIYVRWLRAHPIVSQPYSHTPAPPTWTETKTTITTTAPEMTSVAPEEEWDAQYPGETEADEFTNQANLRVYRVYRSTDRKQWVECDPCLTERAACNYAAYIKANNPREYVRCEDPDGMILSYE